MADVAKNKKYLTLKDLRVSYRKQDDSIHLSSTDDDIPAGFHLPLQRDTHVETQLRQLLQEKGLIDMSSQNFQSAGLPHYAPVQEHYFLSEQIAPTFFPLALSNTGGVLLKDPISGNDEHVLGFDVDGQQTSVSQRLGRFLGKEITTSPHALIFGGTGGGKSVLLRNVFIGCILRPDEWEVQAIDFKKVEFGAWRQYSNVVKSVETTVEGATAMLEKMQQETLRRYAKMENEGKNHFRDLDEYHKRIMIIVDEVGLIFDDYYKEYRPAQVKMQAALAYIARYGRAAGIHLVLSGQRWEDSWDSEMKANIGVRVACGRMDAKASSSILGNNEGVHIKANPRGRVYVRIYGSGNHGQALFAMPDWLEKYLFWNGKRKDGSKINIQDY